MPIELKMHISKTRVSAALALALTALAGTSAWASAEDYAGYRKGDGTPQAVMLSFYDGPTTRGFAWQTGDAVTTGAVWLCQGDFTTPEDITNQVGVLEAGASTTVHAGACTTYRAAVTGLADGRWSYCLGNGDKVVCGQFDVQADPAGPVTIVNVNDVQTKVADKLFMWKDTVTAVTNVLGFGAAADIVLSGGDFIDGDIDVPDVDDYVAWGVVADVARPAFGSMPWIMVSGNHDDDLYGELVGEHYQQTADPAGCHAFDCGNVHVATIPYCNNGRVVPSGVADWLAADLQAAATARWRIVMLHAGPYTTGDHAAKASFIRQMTPLFATNRVDLVLQAHDHTYSRTLPYRWTGGGWTTNEADGAALNLAPATTNLVADGVPHYVDPEGTFYVSAGCAGHRVGEQDAYATRGRGSSSYDTREYKTATDTVKLSSAYATAGDDGSKDVGRPMFAVLKVDGTTLVYDWYVTETNGAAALFDTLRVFKSPPPGEPVPEDEPEAVADVTLAVGETVAFTNAFRRNVRFWLLGSTRGSAVAAAELSVPDAPCDRHVGYARRSVPGTNEVVVTITGVSKGEETISFGRQYKRKDPVHAVSYRVKVK